MKLRLHCAGFFLLLMATGCLCRGDHGNKREVDTTLVGETLTCKELAGNAFAGIYGSRLFFLSSDGNHCLVEYTIDGGCLTTPAIIGTRGRGGNAFDIAVPKIIGDTLYVADVQGYGAALRKIVSIPLFEGSSTHDVDLWRIHDLSWCGDFSCGSSFDILNDGRLIFVGGV